MPVVVLVGMDARSGACKHAANYVSAVGYHSCITAGESHDHDIR